MGKMTFANPHFLILLVLLVPIIAWYIYQYKKTHATLQISNLESIAKVSKGLKTKMRHVLFVLRMLVFVLLVIIIARPQSHNQWDDVSTEGIDIIISLDISGSMLSMDFTPNRLEAAKAVATEFITGRPNDRIGLVVFSGESFTQCPLTTDHAAVINLFNGIQNGMIKDGTAIGDGLANAISRIKDSEAKSKVIILLTDGINNAGAVSPVTAAQIAQTFGIRVYTIGVGKMGTAPYPFQTPYGIRVQDVKVEIDESILKQIAQTTGGEYYRATNNEKLRQIYNTIDTLEKTKFSVQEHKKTTEEYAGFAIAGGILLLIELILRNTLFRSIP
jgi:Ca-activated chloride channel homolog